MQYPPSPLCRAIPWTSQLAGVYYFSPVLNLVSTLVVTEHSHSMIVVLGHFACFLPGSPFVAPL